MKYHRDVTHKSMALGIKQQTFSTLFRKLLKEHFMRLMPIFKTFFFFSHLLFPLLETLHELSKKEKKENLILTKESEIPVY